jgi:hypothetical protein
MFQVFKDDILICSIKLPSVLVSKDVGRVEVKFKVKDGTLIDEFRFYFCTTSGIVGEFMQDGMATVPPNWGLTNFDSLKHILTRLPKPWRVKVGGYQPKRDPLLGSRIVFRKPVDNLISPFATIEPQKNLGI